jgi:hypothetical protein
MRSCLEPLVKESKNDKSEKASREYRELKGMRRANAGSCSYETFICAPTDLSSERHYRETDGCNNVSGCLVAQAGAARELLNRNVPHAQMCHVQSAKTDRQHEHTDRTKHCGQDEPRSHLTRRR